MSALLIFVVHITTLTIFVLCASQVRGKHWLHDRFLDQPADHGLPIGLQWLWEGEWTVIENNLASTPPRSDFEAIYFGFSAALLGNCHAAFSCGSRTIPHLNFQA